MKTVFNAEPADNDPSAQTYLEGRLDYCLKPLITYAQAFQTIRASETTNLDIYGNGM